MKGFRLSVELAAPNPANSVPEELPNENVDVVGSFCSELVATEVGSAVEVVEGMVVVESFVDLTAESRDGKPPNRVGSGWVLGGEAGVGNETLDESPPSGVGASTGVGSTFAGVGKTDVAGEGVIGAASTGGVGEGDVDCAISCKPDVVEKPFVPAERGVWRDITKGAG